MDSLLLLRKEDLRLENLEKENLQEECLFKLILTLLTAVDDATGEILSAIFRKSEDLEGYFLLMEDIINEHGVPLSIYHDKHTIFRSPKGEKLSIEEELLGTEKPLTQFGRAMKELGIIQVFADTPQAKGRVERCFETLQDRLVQELKLEGIKEMEKANEFLKDFIKRYNKKFSVEPKDPISSFRKSPGKEVLENILCVKERRKILKGSVISYRNKLYHLVDENLEVMLLKERTIVNIHLSRDGKIRASLNGKIYELSLAPSKEKVKCESDVAKKERKERRPSENHPWRKYPLFPRKR